MRVAEIAERVGCDPESAYAKFADTREGTRFHNMQWPIFVTDENYRSFCKALADYANSEEGPQSNGRHELFLSVHKYRSSRLTRRVWQGLFEHLCPI